MYTYTEYIEGSPEDREKVTRYSSMLTINEKREVSYHLGQFANLVRTYLDKPSLKQNTMPIQNTARVSLR